MTCYISCNDWLCPRIQGATWYNLRRWIIRRRNVEGYATTNWNTNITNYWNRINGYGNAKWCACTTLIGSGLTKEEIEKMKAEAKANEAGDKIEKEVVQQ